MNTNIFKLLLPSIFFIARVQMDDLAKQYETISVEFSNPFPILNKLSIDRFKCFAKDAFTMMQKPFKRIEMNHPNGLCELNRDVSEKLEKRVVVYMDLVPLSVYVPSYLKPNAYFIDYMKPFTYQCAITYLASEHICSEMTALANAYIGNPQKLTDPNLIQVKTAKNYSIREVILEIEKVQETMSKLIVENGNQSQRLFNKVFRKTSEIYEVNTAAKDVNGLFYQGLRNLSNLQKQINEANTRVDRLIKLIETNPDYQVSAVVADHLSKTIYNFARIIEYFGATLYAQQVVLKAVSDTNNAISRAVS